VKVALETTPIRDLLVVKNEVFEDARGFFLEAYRRDVFEEHGLPATFVQLNHSRSARDVVRGLHFQWEPPMGKLMRVLVGAAYLVAVDLRHGSPTQGRWWGREIAAADRVQVWAPAGFARGFCVVSEVAEIEYLCTGTYNAAAESGIRWNDPELGIPWPTSTPLLSGKDEKAATLREWLAREESRQFTYEKT
jgi:dTDP-4-dehydrorhamnose 3,5-epimerase